MDYHIYDTEFRVKINFLASDRDHLQETSSTHGHEKVLYLPLANILAIPKLGFSVYQRWTPEMLALETLFLAFNVLILLQIKSDYRGWINTEACPFFYRGSVTVWSVN
jgi:hypothetical protein